MIDEVISIMKYNEGDKVRIKSKEWYDANKDEYGNVHNIGKYGWMFTERESRFCGKVVTILLKGSASYAIVEDNCEGFWTDEMIEGKSDDENTLKLESTRTVFEYSNEYARIWLEIYKDDPTTCVFTHLLVDEKHRKQGYGTKALFDAEKIAKNHGCNTVYLMVENTENNYWVYKWYLKCGYKWYKDSCDNYVWLNKNL